MGWYDSTNAILNIGKAKQDKKNDAWRKLMDVAGMGSDIWKVLSGRKYQTGEREAAQQYQTSERVAGQEYQTGERIAGQAYDTGERIAGQEYSTGERVAGETFEANQRNLDRALQERLEKARAQREDKDRATARNSAVNSWIEDTWKAVSEAPEFIDPNTGKFDPKRKEDVRKFLLSSITNNTDLSEAERQFATSVFDGRVDALLPAGAVDVSKNGMLAKETAARAAELASVGRKFVGSNDASALQGVKTGPVPGGGVFKGGAEHPAWMDAEYALEQTLLGVIPSITDPLDKAVAEQMLSDTKRSGQLGPDVYLRYLAQVRALLVKLGRASESSFIQGGQRPAGR